MIGLCGEASFYGGQNPVELSTVQAAPKQAADEEPDQFMCPITFELMNDPVVRALSHLPRCRTV